VFLKVLASYSSISCHLLTHTHSIDSDNESCIRMPPKSSVLLELRPRKDYSGNVCEPLEFASIIKFYFLFTSSPS
jgi:hypothetical protein